MPDPEFDAWNPGLSSEIPASIFSRVTLYDPKNSETDYPTALEAARYCGLKPQEMTGFKVSRMALHEVLIRVTADLHVPDGPNYEELGLNLRGMVDTILTKHVQPKMHQLEAEFSRLQSEANKVLRMRLENDVYARTVVSDADFNPSFLDKLLGRKPPVQIKEEPAELLALAEWQKEIDKTDDPFDLACLESLIAIVGGIVAQRGSLLADIDVVIRLASILVCNSYGSRCIGKLINPILVEAAELEGYRLLPYQREPFVMNVKGASAAGKSTIRPLQRELASRLGVQWEDFALVSPDYWRKYMLDYDSLGEHYKYAAMLTGQELEIVDKKLDGYVAEKAAQGEMPHLLIDRFRFDSFDSSSVKNQHDQLLSRFGHTVFIFFIITPPTETVERAWRRGKTTGRYKAVDDLLYHNIEAYTGMPQLFLKWVNKKEQKVHFEFLDNDVPYGECPKTVAFGWNGEINILDLDCMRRLSSYRRINIEATRPADVYIEAVDQTEDFFETLIKKKLDTKVFDPASLKLKALFRDGECVYETKEFLSANNLDTVRHAAVFNNSEPDRKEGDQKAKDLNYEYEKKFTLGEWGPA